MINEEGFMPVEEDDNLLGDQYKVIQEFIPSDITETKLQEAFENTPEFTEEVYNIMRSHYGFSSTGE